MNGSLWPELEATGKLMLKTGHKSTSFICSLGATQQAFLADAPSHRSVLGRLILLVLDWIGQGSLFVRRPEDNGRPPTEKCYKILQ